MSFNNYKSISNNDSSYKAGLAATELQNICLMAVELINAY